MAIFSKRSKERSHILKKGGFKLRQTMKKAVLVRNTAHPIICGSFFLLFRGWDLSLLRGIIDLDFGAYMVFFQILLISLSY